MVELMLAPPTYDIAALIAVLVAVTGVLTLLAKYRR